MIREREVLEIIILNGSHHYCLTIAFNEDGQRIIFIYEYDYSQHKIIKALRDPLIISELIRQYHKTIF